MGGGALRQQALDDVPVYVGEAPVDSVVPEGELRVVDSEQLENGRVNVVHLHRVCAFCCFITPFVSVPRSPS